MPTIEEVNANVKSAHHRIDGLETEMKDMRELTTAVALVAQNVNGIQSDMTEVKADIKCLSAKPGKLWDTLIGGIVGAVAAGLVGALLLTILK